jgi:hypothetical protein
MRAERIYAVAHDIVREFRETEIVVKIEALIEALKEMADDLSTETQDAVISQRKAIADVLKSSKIEDYPPISKQVILESNLQGLFGQELLSEINEVFSRSQITPTEVVQGLDTILADLKALSESAMFTVDGLHYFGIGEDKLSDGEFEVAITIPGLAIDDELLQFGREAIQLNKILGVFVEIATGSREPIKLRAIASTDPTIYLHSTPAVALLVATSIERIAAFYAQIQGIIKVHRDMKSQSVPKSLLDEMKKHIEDSIGKGLEGVAKQIEKEHMGSIEAGRRKELETELKSALLAIARRLDEGYMFDVRGEDIKPSKDETPEQQTARLARVEHKAFERVMAARPKLTYFERDGDPILGLPKPENDE